MITSSIQLDSPVFQLQEAIFDSPSKSQRLDKQQQSNIACSPNCSSGQPAATHTCRYDTTTASAFSHDDPLMPELLSWISCAAVLGGLAGSIAVTSCCRAIRQATGCAPAPSLQQSDSGSDAEVSFNEQSELYQDDTQAGQVLDKASLTSPYTLLCQQLLHMTLCKDTIASMHHIMRAFCLLSVLNVYHLTTAQTFLHNVSHGINLKI